MVKPEKTDYETELGFKYHTQEFTDASTELRDVGHIGRLAKKQIGTVQDFYDGLEYLDEIYSAYFFEKEQIAKKFLEAKKKLNSKEYKNDVIMFKEGKNSLYTNLKEYESKIIDDLKQILKIMSSDLVKSQLRPRPQIIDDDKYPDIENKTMKEILKGANAIINR